MTALLTPAQRYEEFPITASKVFLAHAAMSPFPRRVCSAIQDYCGKNAANGQWEYLYGDAEEQTRQYAASLIGCEKDEVAFVPSTSAALSMLAGGISWRPGDNIVVADGDFPSNIYPWLNTTGQGAEVKFIPRRADGGVCLDDVARLVDHNTRLVSLSSVNYVTGYRLDIDAIGRYLQERQVLFCVDATQSLGALPFDCRHVDFVAAAAYKWLLGPMGIGVLYISRKHFDTVRPQIVGWKSVKEYRQYLKYDLDFPDNARRYEPSHPNGLGMVGLHAALGLIHEIGIANVAMRLEAMRCTLVESLLAIGQEVISPMETKCASQIVSFIPKKRDAAEVRSQLDSNNFVVSLRDTLDNRNCIRVSPHFYNSDDEIASFLKNVRAFAG